MQSSHIFNTGRRRQPKWNVPGWIRAFPGASNPISADEQTKSITKSDPLSFKTPALDFDPN